MKITVYINNYMLDSRGPGAPFKVPQLLQFIFILYLLLWQFDSSWPRFLHYFTN